MESLSLIDIRYGCEIDFWCLFGHFFFINNALFFAKFTKKGSKEMLRCEK